MHALSENVLAAKIGSDRLNWRWRWRRCRCAFTLRSAVGLVLPSCSLFSFPPLLTPHRSPASPCASRLHPPPRPVPPCAFGLCPRPSAPPDRPSAPLCPPVHRARTEGMGRTGLQAGNQQEVTSTGSPEESAHGAPRPPVAAAGAAAAGAPGTS